MLVCIYFYCENENAWDKFSNNWVRFEKLDVISVFLDNIFNVTQSLLLWLVTLLLIYFQ